MQTTLVSPSGLPRLPPRLTPSSSRWWRGTLTVVVFLTIHTTLPLLQHLPTIHCQPFAASMVPSPYHPSTTRLPTPMAILLSQVKFSYLPTPSTLVPTRIPNWLGVVAAIVEVGGEDIGAPISKQIGGFKICKSGL